MTKATKRIRFLVCIAMLSAMQVVLSRFLSIQTPIAKIGFGFVPVMFAGALYGVGGGALAGALSDVIGALLFPSGSYFPGYTLTAALSGAVYGWLLYRRYDIAQLPPKECGKSRFLFALRHGLVRILLAYVITTLSVTLALNTFWIALGRGYLYVDAAGRNFSNVWIQFFALLPTRLTQAGIMLAVQTVVTFLLLEILYLDTRIREAYHL